MDHSAELLKEADCWNLRSDEKLLEALRKFSVSINERTQSLIEKVDDLTSETVQVGCHLENTFNEFLILADTQFIENVRLFSCRICQIALRKKSVAFLWASIFSCTSAASLSYLSLSPILMFDAKARSPTCRHLLH